MNMSQQCAVFTGENEMKSYRFLVLFTLSLSACGPSIIDGDPNALCHISDLFDASHLSGCNVRWSKKDLPLILHPSDMILKNDLVEITNDFNSMFGIKIITIGEKSSSHTLEINHVDVLMSSDRAGETFYEVTEGWRITNCSVNIKTKLSSKARRLVILHELGHVFGMLHTKAPSIMSTTLTNAPFLDEHIATMMLLYRPRAH